MGRIGLGIGDLSASRCLCKIEAIDIELHMFGGILTYP